MLSSDFIICIPFLDCPDKCLPLFCICRGLVAGNYLSQFKRPLLSHMWYLLPNIQRISKRAVGIGNAGLMDKGSIALITTTASSSVISIGLRGTLWILFSVVSVASILF